MKDPIYSKEMFLQQTAGSLDIATQVADIYLKGYEQEIEDIKKAVREKDLEQVRRLAHKGKSGFLIMGSDPLFQIALNMEQLAKSNDPAALDYLEEYEEKARELAEAIKRDFYP